MRFQAVEEVDDCVSYLSEKIVAQYGPCPHPLACGYPQTAGTGCESHGGLCLLKEAGLGIRLDIF